MRRLSLTATAVAVALIWVTVHAQQQGPRATFAAGELLVQFAPGMSVGQRNGILNARGAGRLRHFDHVDIDHIQLPPGLSVANAVALFQQIPGVVFAQPNYVRHAIQNVPPPNDPYWIDGSLWALNKIQVQPVWTQLTTGDSNVVIADIDTGVNYNHPDLAANMWHNPDEIPGNGIDDDGNGYIDDVYGIDTVNHDSNPLDDQGHGTHTSGTFGAVGNNNLGVTGISWNSKILACKFLSAQGSGTDAGAIECFDYVVALKNRGINIRVTSNSWGETRDGAPSHALMTAIDAAGDAGIVNVFGAGNDSSNNDIIPFDPASYGLPSIIAVASSDYADDVSFFSNYGANSVHVAAPGEDILSTYLGTSYAYDTGTSMATPHVSGVAALLAAIDPGLSPTDIKSIILNNVDQLPQWNGVVSSGGRLNALRAAGAAASGGTNAPPSVSITNPPEGASFMVGTNVTVDAAASDSDGGIMRVDFFANGAPIGSDTTSPYGVSWTNSTPGSYSLTAVAIDNYGSSSTSTAVHVTLLANSPPSVSIVGPAEGATFTAPVTFTIDAVASDSDGIVQQVAFYDNGKLIDVDSTSPYGISWYAPMGSHTLTAVATDNSGGATTSAAVHVTINPIPGRFNVALAANGSAALASSTLSANYPASATINGDRKGLNWGAGGGWNDGTLNASPDWLEIDFPGQKLIDEVDVFSMQDTYNNPVEPTPTMTFNFYGLRGFEVQYWTGSAWAAVPGGTISNNSLVWRQVIFGAVTTSKVRVYVTQALNGSARIMEAEAWGVSAGGNVPPTVSITAPANGAQFTTPANVTVSATAADSDGGVQRVDFFANGAPIGSDTTSPYSVAWNGVTTGSYSLTAVATDNTGAQTTSASVQVNVLASNSAPSIAIVNPAESAQFDAPATINVDVSASDSDGTIQQVTFFVNGSPIATDTTSPFGITWANVAMGSYTLTATATDNLGATATSAPVHITVNPTPGRVNMALPGNGGSAVASSTLNATNYPPAGAINGDRRGLSWGAGGGWNDGTSNQYPDWLEIDFTGMKAIDEVDVFSMQDNYQVPVEPTSTMTFTYYGLKNFEVQYWNGSAWVDVPGGAITNNNLVWRQVTFAAVTTSKIRLYVTSALNGSSRVMELEAWGVSVGGNVTPSVSLTAPSEGASFYAPANLIVTASASDSDGTVQKVDFYANGTLIGTDTASPYSLTWTGVAAGSYTLTAVATDNMNATTTSSPVHITVNEQTNPPPGDRANMALPANGGSVLASSTLGANYPASAAINGDRKGLHWGAGGGWNDGTANASPDWLEVDFNGPKLIDEVNVFSMQDAYTSPVEPTPTMTFNYYGLRGFEVQYWTGSAWAAVPGGTVSNNNLVWRHLVFTSVMTTKIRVYITAALNGYSRVMELEAWGVPASSQEALASASPISCERCPTLHADESAHSSRHEAVVHRAVVDPRARDRALRDRGDSLDGDGRVADAADDARVHDASARAASSTATAAARRDLSTTGLRRTERRSVRSAG